MTTNEFSFILKSSKYGVGVFSVYKIKKGSFLRLFGKETPKSKRNTRIIPKKNIPKIFKEYCIDRGDKMICPNDFGSMPLGWYMNHSSKPNAIHKNYNFYAAKDIKPGEEITIDYNTLEEPDKNKDSYYKK